MSKQTLVFVDMERVPVLHQPTKWWDRGRWWLVRKLGGECPLDTAKYIRIPIDGKTFLSRLANQKRALFDTFGPRAHTLLIGAEDYRELMASPDTGRHAFGFATEVPWRYSSGGQTIYGLTVRVIPWMRGVVVLPEGY